MGEAILSGNLAQGFVMLTDTTHHIGLFFGWDGTVRLMRIWMLLCGDERGETAKHLLECEESLIKLAVRGKEVDQHW